MNQMHVLVVDDEPGMRHSITRALQNDHLHLPELDYDAHFVMATAASGEEALEMLTTRPPDLVLLDYKMGGMTGLEVLRHLNQKTSDLLIIMITAFATIETAVQATKSGAFDFIAKPFTPDELRDTVRKAAVHLVTQRRARQLAEEKRRVRFEFIRVLGHELKAPLAAIENYLLILRDQTLGQNLAGYEKVIKRCLTRSEGMRKLIIDLLDMTRIESGEKQRAITQFDLVPLARQVMETHQPVAEGRRIGLELQAPATLLMRGDRNELEIVLNNLLSNAIKYNRDSGRVLLGLEVTPDDVQIAVTDSGIGLTPEEAAQLFQDFSRIKNEQTRDISGSGLGLSIVKKIALLYNGTVAVRSVPGSGSTFTVHLRSEKPTAT
ncbi:MAG: Sensor histidine kinase RcsC [Phycisphaerae bacterium]|nr:Sensor histidine kinase RcsC [Phycisphaerae bacterium]